jgi:hypothetical protein
MPSIKSDIMNKSYGASQGLRQFDVSDESETTMNDDDDFDADVRAMNARLAERHIPPLDEKTIKAMRAQQALVQQAASAPEMSIADVERQVADARQAKQNPTKGRLNPAAKRRIEMLCGFSKNTRTVMIDDNEYVLKTLKGKEVRESLIQAAFYDGTVGLPFETRKQLLARAIMKVAGTDVELFLGDPSMEARLELVDELDERIVNKLYTEYLVLLDEVNKKYALKTEADAQEVAADIKK